MLTLMARPIGALLFGRLADRFGRRPVLMVDVLLFSVLELACAFAPSLTVLLVLRFLFGIAMGGEWGIGASLAMESIPAKARGPVSGLLQSGYPCGYFLGAHRLLGGLQRAGAGLAGDVRRRRAAGAAGALPARQGARIAELGGQSQAAAPSGAARWSRCAATGSGLLYMMLLMAAFNMFSHGSQDMYPTFLKSQMHLQPGTVTVLTMLLNAGAIVGGLTFGSWSERVGRRRAMVVAALAGAAVHPAVDVWRLGRAAGRSAPS